MAKKRVYEVAREEGLPSSLVVQRLQRAGLDIKTASSTVDVAEALHVLSPGKYPKPDSMTEREAATATVVAEAEKPDETAAAGADEAEAKPRRRRPTTRRPTSRRPNTARAAETPKAETTEATAEAAPSEAAARPRPTRPRPRKAAQPRSVADEARAAVPPAPSSVQRVKQKLSQAQPPQKERDLAAEAAAVAPPVERSEGTAVKAPEAAAAETLKAPKKPEPKVEPTAKKAESPREARKAEHDVAPSATEAEPSATEAEPTAAAEAPAAPPKEKAVPAEKPAQPKGGGKRRRVVIDSQASRRESGPGGGQSRERKQKARDVKPAVEEAAPPVGEPVSISSGSTVKDVADAFEVGSADVMKTLMTMGEMATITQSLSDEAIELLGEELGRPVSITKAEEELEQELEFHDDPSSLQPRAPVVTVMGHVDHGKTSLLDAVRKTEVAAGEAGGITQHIGAYQVHHGERLITFLDTPGHEAFTAMRARGAKITDVAVIVVAADDGVMPQTKEAIDHARAAEVPFIVAVNKIDKAGANPDRVKQEMSQDEIVPTSWGGDHEFVEVSAKEGTGLEDLLETVLLVADADAEPRANPDAEASGTVVESRLDAGRGPVATLLVQRGTLKMGDVVLAGESSGRVRAMTDHTGRAIESAGPSVPVELLGLDGVVDAGEKFRVMGSERDARNAAADLSRRLRAEELANRKPVSLDDLFDQISEGGLKDLNLIIKADVQGSAGALVDALEKIDQSEVRIRVISTGVGAVTESDVMLASASQAIIIAFNVRPRPEARNLAEAEGVDIRNYRVIYRAIEDITAALEGMLEPEIVEDVVGTLEVRATFRASRIGTIAGSYVTEGEVRRGAKVRVVRDGTVVHEGEIASLRRFDEDVREVASGFECGVLISDFNDVKEGDELEIYELREVARTAEPAAAE
ncbi:MAG: translation initiation factor IF-2 [Thermoleophilia bacterium]|nr:translation initiation factor IF-2 [Thermoleophilia bacterium]MDH3725177.1 translation initiation factor IF-2 [Thermoleophilia bacterium]